MRNTAFAITLSVLSIGTVGASAVTAFAQDRTQPSDSLTNLQPPIDLRPGQIFVTQGAMYGMGVGEGRSVGYLVPASRNQDGDLDR